MKQPFAEPNFADGIIEFRVEGDEIVIYATPEGLRWLAQKCLALVDAGKKDHLHLAEYQVLTKVSRPVVLAQFPLKSK
jgi:hypothetical protein